MPTSDHRVNLPKLTLYTTFLAGALSSIAVPTFCELLFDCMLSGDALVTRALLSIGKKEGKKVRKKGRPLIYQQDVHDDGLSPSVMKALVTEEKLFFFSVTLHLRGNFLAQQSAQRRDFLFLRALSVLRGSIFNFPKRGAGA